MVLLQFQLYIDQSEFDLIYIRTWQIVHVTDSTISKFVVICSVHFGHVL